MTRADLVDALSALAEGAAAGGLPEREICAALAAGWLARLGFVTDPLEQLALRQAVLDRMRLPELPEPPPGATLQ